MLRTTAFCAASSNWPVLRAVLLLPLPTVLKSSANISTFPLAPSAVSTVLQTEQKPLVVPSGAVVSTSCSSSSASCLVPVSNSSAVPSPPLRDNVTVNVLPDNSNDSAILPFFLSPELRKIIPQPQFSGERAQWSDFEREFGVWWRFRKLDDEFKGLALVSCLPAKEQELYRKRISHQGLRYDNIIADLRSRFSVQDEFSTRARWYACKCRGEDSGSFLSWFTEWTLLKERVQGVSAEEEKNHFLRALPEVLLNVALQKSESEDSTVAALEKPVRSWIEMRKKRDSLQKQLSSDKTAQVSADASTTAASSDIARINARPKTAPPQRPPASNFNQPQRNHNASNRHVQGQNYSLICDPGLSVECTTPVF